MRDRRVPPRGVLPRQLQTWLMLGIAGLIVAIILIAGHPQPPAPPRSTPASAAPTLRVSRPHSHVSAATGGRGGRDNETPRPVKRRPSVADARTRGGRRPAALTPDESTTAGAEPVRGQHRAESAAD